MRILHLIDPQSPDGGPCTLRLLADVTRRVDSQQRAVVIGGRHEVELAVRCGVDVTGWVCPPRALPWAGISALRASIRTVERASGRVDLVHAWTARSGALAATAFPLRTCITSLHVGPDLGVQVWHSLRTLRRLGSNVLVASTAIRKQLRARGMTNDRVTLLPPGVTPHAAASDREAIRAVLAERNDVEITGDTLLVGLLGEPACSADANMASTIAARVVLSGRRIRLLVHPNATDRFGAELLMHHLNFDELIITDELMGEPWKIASALDSALLVNRRDARSGASSVLPLLHVLSAGTPVVAEQSESLRDVMEDGMGCMIFPPGEVNLAAQHLARLSDDQAHRQRVVEQGKSLATDMFDIDAYAMRLRHSYDLLLANRTVHTTSDPFALSDVSAGAMVA